MIPNYPIFGLSIAFFAKRELTGNRPGGSFSTFKIVSAVAMHGSGESRRTPRCPFSNTLVP
jgi:hypothetical protein